MNCKRCASPHLDPAMFAFMFCQDRLRIYYFTQISSIYFNNPQCIKLINRYQYDACLLHMGFRGTQGSTNNFYLHGMSVRNVDYNHFLVSNYSIQLHVNCKKMRDTTPAPNYIGTPTYEFLLWNILYIPIGICVYNL